MLKKKEFYYIIITISEKQLFSIIILWFQYKIRCSFKLTYHCYGGIHYKKKIVSTIKKISPGLLYNCLYIINLYIDRGDNNKNYPETMLWRKTST